MARRPRSESAAAPAVPRLGVRPSLRGSRPVRRRRRSWYLSPEGFRELRLSLCLSQKAAASLLGVCLRTIQHWDAGRCRVPWSAVRLLRILRSGELASPAWSGWTVHGDLLRSPEGHGFRASELGYWSLLVAQARAFRARYDRETRGGVGAAVPARPQAVPPLRAGGDGVALDPLQHSVPSCPLPAEPACVGHRAAATAGGSGQQPPAVPSAFRPLPLVLPLALPAALAGPASGSVASSITGRSMSVCYQADAFSPVSAVVKGPSSNTGQKVHCLGNSAPSGPGGVP